MLSHLVSPRASTESDVSQSESPSLGMPREPQLRVGCPHTLTVFWGRSSAVRAPNRAHHLALAGNLAKSTSAPTGSTPLQRPPPPSAHRFDALMRLRAYRARSGGSITGNLGSSAPTGRLATSLACSSRPPHALAIAPCRKHSPRTLILPDVHGLRWLRLCEPHRSCRATAYVTTHPPQAAKPAPNAPTP